jgi:hypothetical protein
VPFNPENLVNNDPIMTLFDRKGKLIIRDTIQKCFLRDFRTMLIWKVLVVFMDTDAIFVHCESYNYFPCFLFLIDKQPHSHTHTLTNTHTHQHIHTHTHKHTLSHTHTHTHTNTCLLTNTQHIHTHLNEFLSNSVRMYSSGG